MKVTLSCLLLALFPACCITVATAGDARTTTDLMKILAETHPSEPPRGPDYFDRGDDPWRIAFDSLISKPGNLSKAQSAVAAFNPAGILVHDIFSGNILDENGQRHLLLIGVSNSGNPGVDRIGYYLFDQDGKFEQAAVFYGGHNAWASETAELDAAKKRISWHTNYIGGNHYIQIFAVEKGRLVSREMTLNGKPFKIGGDKPGMSPGQGETVLMVDGN